MATIKAETIETVEQNLDDQIWDHELAEGACVQPAAIELAREIAPDAMPQELRRAAYALTASWDPADRCGACGHMHRAL